MQTYLVGGAIRDKLLGLPVRERDWVVVGSSAEDMLNQGFHQVGKDFPVFLHPKTKEEYALARTERKTSSGYKGFSVHASPDITLEQDLYRRDLTINAIAEDNDGNLIDPYDGQADLKSKCLRHISDAFKEDPVRILRVARFSARFEPLQFNIAPETIKLMQEMVQNGEVHALVPERVWSEFQKALSEPTPQQFFQSLSDCHAIEALFPEETNLAQGIASLNQACKLSESSIIRFAAWAHHLGEKNIKSLCQRLNPPKEFQELAMLVSQFHSIFEKSTELPPPDILATLKALDGFRRPERFESFLLAAEAVSRSIPEHHDWPHPQREYLHSTLLTAQKITAKNLTKVGLQGEEIAKELDMHRRAAISKVKRTYRWAKFN